MKKYSIEIIKETETVWAFETKFRPRGYVTTNTTIGVSGAPEGWQVVTKVEYRYFRRARDQRAAIKKYLKKGYGVRVLPVYDDRDED